MRAALVAALLAAATPAAAEPALWLVKDADTEVVLFGTLHMLPAGTRWLTPRIAARLDASDTLVLEAVLPASPYALAGTIRALGIKEGLPPLAARVPPGREKLLAQTIRAAGLPVAALDRMETWLAAITLSNAALLKLGLSPEAGVEAGLTARATAAAKPIVPLESAEQQLLFLDTLPEADQRALLDATLDSIATARADVAALVGHWQAGEAEAIGEKFDSEMSATPKLAEVLLTARNKRWADWIKAVLARPGKVFVAVGAGHLTGADSVQAMLAARGVAVARLP